MSKAAQGISLITGASSGFGRALAKAALAAGNAVIGTVRRDSAKVEFEGLHAHHAHGVLLDVSDFDSINATIREVVERVGQIDVLVNSAGYGHEGILEESPLKELRRQFEVNVFGAVAMIKAVLGNPFRNLLGFRENVSGGPQWRKSFSESFPQVGDKQFDSAWYVWGVWPDHIELLGKGAYWSPVGQKNNKCFLNESLLVP